MARFITTIQLQQAADKDYEMLDNELEKRSFTRAEMNDGGKAGDSHAYNREGNVTIQQVTAAVLKAAEKTGKKFSFTIIRNKHFYN